MNFLLLLATVGLISFAAVSAAGSLVSALGFALLARTAPGVPARRASLLFALRVLPSAVALLVVFGLVVPSFVVLEPSPSGEAVGAGLLVPAAFGAALLGAGFARGLRSWGATRRLVADWTRSSEPLCLPSIAVPARLIDHPFPVVCVAGILRPRLFVARQVLERFTSQELAAVTAHEAGHLAARDNLKALVMRACPDWLALFPAGRRLERAWSRMAEEAADDHAADGTPRALDLADALLKVARLAPPGAHVALPMSAFHNGDRLAERVARLTSDEAGAGSPPVVDAFRGLGWGVLAALGALVASVDTQADVLSHVHGVTESLVRFLQ